MNPRLMSALAVGLFAAPAAFAVPITLDFEGASSFLSVDNYYNGGTDQGGLSGTNYGISFGGGALAVSNDELGPYFSHAPSPGSVLAPVDADSALNRVDGFTDAVSFFYSATDAATVGIYSGLNGTGDLLGLFNLTANAQQSCSDSPYCYWQQIKLDFSGIAQSIQFGGAAGVAGFDDVKLTAVPEPATMLLFGTGLLGVFGLGRRRAA